MSELKIAVENLEADVVLVTAEGHLDAHTFEKMEKKITELFDDGHHKLILKLDKLDYISSAGAGVFIGAIGVAQENGGNIVLLTPTKTVCDVFDLLGLTQIFPIAQSAEEAKNILKG